jgi:hypothetical protein
MSNEEKLPAKRVAPAGGTLTLARKNDLVKMLKDVEKAAPDALEVLLRAMQDDKTDAKIRVDIAKTLLDTRIKLSESICRDQLQRTLGEHRMQMDRNPTKMNPKDIGEDDDDQPQRAAFVNDVLDISKTKNL